MCLCVWLCSFRLSAVFGLRYPIIASRAESLFFTLMTHQVVLWAYTDLVSIQRVGGGGGGDDKSPDLQRNKWDSIWCYILLWKQHSRNLTENVTYFFVSICLIVYILMAFWYNGGDYQGFELGIWNSVYPASKSFSFLFSTSLELQSGFYFSIWICCVALL